MSESTGKPKDLAALRSDLVKTDTELVRLMAERASLIRSVAQYKADHGLPSFDREREGALLDVLLARATEAGLSGEVVKDVFTSLFEASRYEQRRFMQSRTEHFSIGIIGGTQGMGAFIAKV